MNRTVIIAMGLLSFLFGSRSNPAAEIEPPKSANVFADLRAKYFTLTRNDSCPKPSNPDEPWGAMMEVGYAEAIVTTVAFTDGTASILRSSGGGFFGGGTVEPVKTAAEGFLRQAQHFQPKTSATKDFPQPSPGRVVFYLFSDSGHFTWVGTERELAEESHPFSALYYSALRVLHEYLKLEKKHPR